MPVKIYIKSTVRCFVLYLDGFLFFEKKKKNDVCYTLGPDIKKNHVCEVFKNHKPYSNWRVTVNCRKY